MGSILLRIMGRKAFSNHRHASWGLIALIALTVSMFATASGVFAQEPPARNFFGTIVSIEDNVLQIDTTDGVALEVTVTDDTAIVLPLNSNADITDLFEGDVVAVSLVDADQPLIAGKIFVVSTQTKHKHIPGDVLDVTASHITIDPVNETADSLTFNITDETTIQYRRRATNLDVGSFVIVLAVRNPSTGDLSPDAIEIYVVPARPTPPPTVTQRPPVNEARVRGVLEEVNEDENWLVVAGTKVVVTANTRIASGLVIGQMVQAAGQLLDDGSIIASQIEAIRDDPVSVERLLLEGVFQGLDDSRNWLISGTVVIVRPGIDIDGRPTIGQRVRVNAIVLEDGSIVAREIQLIRAVSDSPARVDELRLEGVFQGVEDGNWIVSQIEIGVDEDTELEGSPEVGSRIKVRAVIRDDGSFLALHIELEDADDDSDDTRKKVELEGLIQRVFLDAGELVSITVRGHVVRIVELTEIRGDIGVGLTAEVDAILMPTGAIIAREIETKNPSILRSSEESKVDIKGVIQRVNDDATLIQVNGIVIKIGENARVQGEPRIGSPVTGEGVLQSDGTVLASSLRIFALRDAVDNLSERIRGIVDEVIWDDSGNVVGVVIDGRRIRIGALTRISSALKRGDFVEVEGVLSGGNILAQEVGLEDDEDGQQGSVNNNQRTVSDTAVRNISGNAAIAPATVKFRHEGVVQAIERRANVRGGLIGIIWIGERKIFITSDTEIEGDIPTVGSYVEVEGQINGDTAIATRIEIEDSDDDDNNFGRGSSSSDSLLSGRG